MKRILYRFTSMAAIAVLAFASSCSKTDDDYVIPKVSEKKTSDAELPEVVIIGHNPVDYSAIVQEYDASGEPWTGSNPGGSSGGSGGGGGGGGGTGGGCYTCGDGGATEVAPIPPKTVFVYTIPSTNITDVQVRGEINDGVLTGVTTELTGITAGKNYVETGLTIHCGGGSCGGIYSYTIEYRIDYVLNDNRIVTGAKHILYGTYNPVTHKGTLINR